MWWSMKGSREYSFDYKLSATSVARHRSDSRQGGNLSSPIWAFVQLGETSKKSTSGSMRNLLGVGFLFPKRSKRSIFKTAPAKCLLFCLPIALSEKRKNTESMWKPITFLLCSYLCMPFILQMCQQFSLYRIHCTLSADAVIFFCVYILYKLKTFWKVGEEGGLLR